MKALLERIRKILRDRRTRKFLTRLVSGVAAVVVFITTYALVLPAITMESQAACGIEAHQHDDSCYTDELICGQEESEGHHHTEDCYTVTKDLVCPLEEHQHSAENGCYDEDGNLICKLEEHTHTDSCYEEHRELTCELEETDGHTHTASCYKKVLTCGKPVHTHSAACYKADPEIQSAAVASTGMTSAAATSDYSVEEYAQEESHDGSIGSQAFDEPEEIGTENQNPGEEIIDEDSSSAETEDNQDANQDAYVKDENADKEISDEGISQAETENDPVADFENNPATDLENENADDNSVAAESDDKNRNDDSESKDEKDEKDEKADAFETGDTAFEESADEENLNTEDEDNDNNADREGEESASSFSTGFAAEDDEDSYIPEKEALDFNTVLNNKTGIYYHHLEAGETVEDSSAITDWIRVDEDTELSPEDLIRVYLGYTLPADAINATNDIARYRLPDTLHLTDEQIDAINKCENGISSQYVDYSKLEITDIERHAAYLGLESVEGTRTPDEELKEDSQEFISATVKAEKIYDEDNGEYKGTDLIFTFSPYTVEKNAHAYDKEGQPTKAGEKVKGWLMLDFNLGQVDWEEDRTSEIVFAKEDEESHISEIRTILRQANPSEDESDDSAAYGMTEAAAEYATEEIASEYSTEEIVAEDMTAEASVADATADAATVDATEEVAAADNTSVKAGEASTNGATTETAKNLSDDKTNQEEQTAASYPAAVFDDSITVRSGRLDTDLADTDLPRKTKMTVHVEADEGTFPEGTKMVLSPVDDLDAVAEAVGTAVDAKTRGFQAVDITFYDKDPSEEGAKEIEPLKPIRVSIKSDEIRKAAEDSSTAPVVVHIEDDNTATEVQNTASRTDSAAIEIEKPGVEEGNIPSESKTTDDNSAVQEKDNGTGNNTPDTDADEDTADSDLREDQIKENPNEETREAVQDQNTPDTGEVSSAPEKSNDAVDTDLEDSLMDNADTEADTASSEQDNATVESNKEDMSTATDTEAVNTVTDEESPAENTSETENNSSAAHTDDSVNFEADSFSVYAIVYTVDFHWEVDGKAYEFNLPGGGFVSFTKLMESLGVSENEEQNDSGESSSDTLDKEKQDASVLSLDSVQVREATKNFVKDVEKVEFSSPELLSVSKVEEESTVGAIKEDLGLECEYSAKLTEEDIAKINDTKVEGGDWALISLKPFDTEETLTVTMKDGGVFTVVVTDNQASDPFGIAGSEYIITNNAMNLSLRWRISNDGTGVRTGEVRTLSDNVWKFEFDEDANEGAGGYYLCAQNGDTTYYLNVTDGEITLTDIKAPPDGEEPQEGAKYATPLIIHYDEGSLRYTISASSNGIGSYLTFRDYNTITIDNTTANPSNPGYTNNLLQFRNPEDPSHVPGTIGTWDIKNDGIKLSLFDYQGYVYNHYYIDYNDWGRRKEGTCDSTIDQEWGSDVRSDWLRAGDGINRDRSLLFTGTGLSNQDDFNNFTGVQGTYYSGSSYQGIVENNAVKIENADGTITYYPRLTQDKRLTTSDRNEQGSLAYLFDGNDRWDTKRYYSNQGSFKSKTVYDNNGAGLEGLLRKDELGYYYYDSEQNYARLNAAEDEILVYADTYNKDKGQTEVKTEKIGMFPFDDYDTSKHEEKTPANRDNGYNHQFGMTISAEFVYPPNGIVPETGLPETFEFSGDDDVWVFIDGVLVLDLGGVHQPISGKIDFSKLNDNNGVTITHFNSDGNEFTYQGNQIRSIQEAFTKANKTFDSSPYSTHQIDFFYLERGGADSNCSIRFNLLFMKQMEIAKQINGLTPVERANYRDDTFNLETGVKHNDNGIHMHDNSVSYWSNDANWRDKKDKDNKEFETYETANQTGIDPVNNYTIKKYQNGSKITGEVMTDGQFTLKDGESMTITHMPASDVFYAAEQNQPVMRRYETPHAERNYKNMGTSVQREEEAPLHVANAKGGSKTQDWETRAYKASETDLLTFTNTLKEKNFTVRKIWEDSKERDAHDPVSFKLRATVDGEDYSEKINAQWTETTNKTKTTTTDVYDPNNDNLKYQLKKENDWEITFEHLPARTNEEEGGREIIYSVIEDPEPQTYTVLYNPPEKTNVQYLDLFKFWPDGNDMHDGTTVSGVERKNEVIKTYIRRNDGKYVTASLDENGEYVYSGVVDGADSATEFVITSDNRQRTRQPNLALYNLPEMFDYAGRVNKVPKSNADELPEPEEGEEPQTPTPYTYELVQLTDEDENTKGLVMFTRPLEEASILNKKDQIYIEKEWFDSEGNKLTEDERPDSITYSIYQLVHEHEWAVYDKTTKQWDYSRKADGSGWYVIQEGKIVNGVWKDGLEMRQCRFGSCNHYTEQRTQVFEPCQTHNFGEWVGEERTCTEGTEQTRVCQRCGATETRELGPLGHAYQIDENRSRAATCTEGGHNVYVCPRCGDEYEEDTVALGHDFPKDWIIDGNTKWHECKRGCGARETINLNELFPGTNDCYLVDWNDVWPKWTSSDDMNAKKPVSHSRIFKYNNKYYVIYRDNAAGVDRTNWANGAATPQEILNYVLEVKTPVKNANDIWGDYTAKTGIGGTGPNQIQRGSLVKEDGSYYVYLSDQYGSGIGIKRPAADNVNWYKVPNINEGTSGANGSNGTNGLHSANAPSPTSVSGKTFSISQKPTLRAANDNKTGDGEKDGQENEQEPPVDGGARGQATNKDLTQSILLADLNLTGLGVKNPNTGDKLVEFSLRQTLETKDDSDTLVENEDNLWRTVVDVPLAKEGFEYRYYIVEDVPTPGEELDGNRYETTYNGQSNGLTDEGVTRITNVLQRTGSLKITKNVTINNEAVGDNTKPSLADGIYTFTVTKKGDNSFEPLTVTMTITNGKPSTEEVTDLDPGTYIVKENARDNHTTLTMINNATTTSDQAEVEVVAGKVADTAPVVSFTNNLVNTSIRVIKVKEGTEAPISGAKFTLTRVDEDGRNITGNEAYSQEKTAGLDGTLEFTDLWAGRYKLEETFTPDGYIKKEGPYYITIGQNGTGTLDTTVEHTMISPETGNEYTVENEPGVELPYTGGPGTRVYTILGFILVTFTGIFLMRRQLPID